MKKHEIVSLGLCIVAFSALEGCGGNETPVTPPPAANAAPVTSSVGDYNLNCGAVVTATGTTPQVTGQQASEQFPLPPQPECLQRRQGQQSQTFEFPNSMAADLEFTVDCSRRVVVVKNKGIDPVSQEYPIQTDGRIAGSLPVQQKALSDGKGNTNCFVATIVNFTGQTSCPPVTAGPASGEAVQVNTSVAFAHTDNTALIAAGILPNDGSTGQAPGTVGASPSPGPSVYVSPSPSPNPSPSSSPSPTPSPSVSPGPSASPSPIATPVVFCVVEDPCPLVGTSNLTCPSP